MACQDEGQGRTHDAQIICEQQERLDQVTRMLCNVLDMLETAEGYVTTDDLSTETQKWWTQHKATDAKRVAAEREEERARREVSEKRENALSKLTPEERHVLGLPAK